MTLMTFEEYKEFGKIVFGLANELVSMAQEKTASTINPPDWYAGITGQEDKDRDGKADRYNGHPVQKGTWVEMDVENHELAKAIEDELHRRGYQGGGNRGNMSLKPTYVYLYKIDMKQKLAEFFKSTVPV